MRILSIETSCDETALAVLSVKKGTFTQEAHTVASQIELHKKYGGVFPMMAKREHAKNIFPLFKETLTEAGLLNKIKKAASIPEKKVRKILEREPELLEYLLKEMPYIQKPKVDKIAVTIGPGLEPALWVGINFARALSVIWDIPLAPVNHMEGHILSVFPKEQEGSFTVSKLPFPLISLLISGGHTELVLVKGIGKYSLIGATRDDAAGEAFDKVARMMNLPYPGGPQISKLAESAQGSDISLPRPMIHTNNFDFSFSGLKTAVLYLLRDTKEVNKKELAKEFQDAVVDVLVAKTLKAIEKYKARHLIVGGGVAANKELRRRLPEASPVPVSFPTKELSTDNAVMIAIAGYFSKTVGIGSKKLKATGNLSF